MSNDTTKQSVLFKDLSKKQGQFVLSKNFRRNNGLGSILDLAARMG